MTFLFLPDHIINIKKFRGTVVEFPLLFTVITFFLKPEKLVKQSVCES